MPKTTPIALVLAFIVTAAVAQLPAPSTGDRGAGAASRVAMATPYTALHSPEVHPDRTVTLRFRAPNATQVEVVGEIMQGKGPLAMTKAEDGRSYFLFCSFGAHCLGIAYPAVRAEIRIH